MRHFFTLMIIYSLTSQNSKENQSEDFKQNNLSNIRQKRRSSIVNISMQDVQSNREDTSEEDKQNNYTGRNYERIKLEKGDNKIFKDFTRPGSVDDNQKSQNKELKMDVLFEKINELKNENEESLQEEDKEKEVKKIESNFVYDIQLDQEFDDKKKYELQMFYSKYNLKPLSQNLQNLIDNNVKEIMRIVSQKQESSEQDNLENETEIKQQENMNMYLDTNQEAFQEQLKGQKEFTKMVQNSKIQTKKIKILKQDLYKLVDITDDLSESKKLYMVDPYVKSWIQFLLISFPYFFFQLI